MANQSTDHRTGAPWPADHPAEILRGTKRLAPADVRRHLARRCSWLATRIEAAKRVGDEYALFVVELDALVQAAEAFDAARGNGSGPSQGRRRWW